MYKITSLADSLSWSISLIVVSPIIIWKKNNKPKHRFINGRNLFSIANDCSVNPSNLSKMLVKKQMKYFDVQLEHEWKVPVLQELLNTRMNNLHVEEFDDNVITEIQF